LFSYTFIYHLITRENQSDGINGNIRDLIRLYNKKHI